MINGYPWLRKFVDCKVDSTLLKKIMRDIVPNFLSAIGERVFKSWGGE
jgi:hypothetical protein